MRKNTNDAEMIVSLNQRLVAETCCSSGNSQRTGSTAILERNNEYVSASQ